MLSFPSIEHVCTSRSKSLYHSTTVVSYCPWSVTMKKKYRVLVLMKIRGAYSRVKRAHQGPRESTIAQAEWEERSHIQVVDPDLRSIPLKSCALNRLVQYIAIRRSDCKSCDHICWSIICPYLDAILDLSTTYRSTDLEVLSEHVQIPPSTSPCCYAANSSFQGSRTTSELVPTYNNCNHFSMTSTQKPQSLTVRTESYQIESWSSSLPFSKLGHTQSRSNNGKTHPPPPSCKAAMRWLHQSTESSLLLL